MRGIDRDTALSVHIEQVVCICIIYEFTYRKYNYDICKNLTGRKPGRVLETPKKPFRRKALGEFSEAE